MPLEHYIVKGGQRLRCGYTTGTCAALAAQAAVTALLRGQFPSTAALNTPKGIRVEAPVLDGTLLDGAASCAIEKDGGDDTDVTDGALVYASARFSDLPGVSIEGGSGVGRVTRPGLEQPVGAAAINSVPRRMIAEAVEDVLRELGSRQGILITISVPGGGKIAARTFNPQLGIEGGISILGTSGIVEPQSVAALVETIRVEMQVAAAEGGRHIVITPGNYGEAFLPSLPVLARIPYVKCSNFIGDALDFSVELGFERVLLVGHIGKYIKLAGGIMNTHSKMADCRAEIVTAHAALMGADRALVQRLMESTTTDQALSLLDEAGLRQGVVDSVLEAIQRHVSRRAEGGPKAGVVLFSNRFGFLGASKEGVQIQKEWECCE